MSVRSQLERRASEAGLSLDDQLRDQLVCYFELLKKWNDKVSLSSLPIASDGDEAIDRLLLEPVAAAGYLPLGPISLLDVGSGGGSPAIPLKLVRANLSLHMLESREKKAAFLREAVRRLTLSETTVHTTRFEALDRLPGFGAVSIRAVRVDASLLEHTARVLEPDGTLLLFQSETAGHDSSLPSTRFRVAGRYPLLRHSGSQLCVLVKA